ncbi:transmembrane protein 132C [Electrophorus electricus]|uniref:transmembrane protein 132C n=1 Tax=Electrophorus electricus TaxID=8005 RepID=UPI0015CFF1BA|nr:transmembrane protein 132C [Electrophorus electricus]
MEVFNRAEANMLRLYALHSVVILLGVTDSQIPDSPQRYPSSAYLPVSFQLLHADSSFFLKEATQEFMRNSSLLSRTEAFFIHQARQPPALSATYGRLRAEQPVPLDLLQTPGSYVASSTLFTFNWKLQTFVLGERLYLDRPTVRVLFYVGGRDWDDYSAVDKLPCVQMFAFHETQEVRGSCRLRGELGVCVAELEPPHSWFAAPSVVPGRQRGTDASEGTSVELYYSLRSAEAGDCPGEDAGTRNSARLGHEGAFGSAMSTPMRRIGSVRLFRTLAVPELSEHRLDGNFAVLVPSAPVRPRDSVSAYVAASPFSPVEMFTLRVKLQDGVAFLGARPCNPTLWMVSQDVRSEGHRVVTLHCRRKESSYGQRVEPVWQRVVQVDLEMDVSVDTTGSGSISWMVEYPGIRVGSEETETHVLIVQRELAGVVPLAMDTEILNTAVLNGRTVAVPVKVVTVTTDGAITDVSDMVQCRSTDEDVVKVSDRCDYVYVNGKEMRGHVHMLVNFTYSYVTAQLELQVWIPRLPLQIDVSDTELSQIKGWRVPAAPNAQRSARDSEDEDDEERRGRSCTLQYQRATVRVLTHFVAESADVRGQLTYMLGSDWQLDITGLVWDFLKVENTRIARLQEGRLIEGLDTGMTSVQVLSPLSDSILAEKSVRVLEERVSVTELGLQLVSGLTLTLQLSTGSNRAVSATATTQEVLDTPKQEALISAWLQFSDGSMAPLDQYSSEHFVLTALSLDEAVVSVRQDVAGRWPVVSAEAEGRGLLVRVEMSVCEACQKFKRRSVLAAGNCNVLVKFGRGEGGSRPTGHDYTDELENRGGERHRNPELPDRTGMDGHYFGSSVSDTEDGAMRRITTTTKTTILRRPGGNKLSDAGRQVPNVPVDFSDFPAQVDLPRGRNVYEDDLVQSPRSLSDLEIGMYALLGVFCLAILVFLINCISYTLKYRHKELSVEGQESMNHAHDWVWLGNEAELLESHVSLSPQTEERLTIMDSSIGGLEEGSQLLNGGSSQKNAQGHLHRRAESAAVCTGKDGKGESPTTKRKRVKFTTFTTIPVESVCAASDALGEGPNQDIKWVCQDVELGDSKDLQNYMERLSDVA